MTAVTGEATYSHYKTRYKRKLRMTQRAHDHLGSLYKPKLLLLLAASFLPQGCVIGLEGERGFPNVLTGDFLVGRACTSARLILIHSRQAKRQKHRKTATSLYLERTMAAGSGTPNASPVVPFNCGAFLFLLRALRFNGPLFVGPLALSLTYTVVMHYQRSEKSIIFCNPRPL